MTFQEIEAAVWCIHKQAGDLIKQIDILIDAGQPYEAQAFGVAAIRQMQDIQAKTVLPEIREAIGDLISALGNVLDDRQISAIPAITSTTLH